MKWIDCTHQHNLGRHDLADDNGELLMCCETWGITQEQFDAIPKQAEQIQAKIEIIKHQQKWLDDKDAEIERLKETQDGYHKQNLDLCEQITNLEDEIEQKCESLEDADEVIQTKTQEINNLVNEVDLLQKDNDEQAEQLMELWEFVIDSEHHAGCSGGFGEQYRCKCGLRELLNQRSTKAAQPQGGSDEP